MPLNMSHAGQRLALAAQALAPMLVLSVWPVPALASGAQILQCRAVADLAQRFICYESIVVPGAAAAAPDDARFGMENRLAPSLTAAMASTITGAFKGWAPNDTVQLANGQRWQIADDSRGVMNASNPKVTVRRGAMGAFYLEIEGTNRSPKVRRLP
jgi:hypothetical protein